MKRYDLQQWLFSEPDRCGFFRWRNDTFPNLAPHFEPWTPKPFCFLFGISQSRFWKSYHQFLAVEIIVDQIHRGINTITSFPFSSSPPKTKYISPNINWGVCLQHRQSWSIITATPGNWNKQVLKLTDQCSSLRSAMTLGKFINFSTVPICKMGMIIIVHPS